MTVPEKHRAIAHAWIDGAEIEKYGPLVGYWYRDHFPTWDEVGEYRAAPKAKVKKWRWVAERSDGSLFVTSAHYPEAVKDCYLLVQKIDSTMIGVDE